MQQNASSKKDKCTSSTWLKVTWDSADEGQNSDTLMFLVTTLEMILTGYKKKNIIIIVFHLRIYFVAFLMSFSISIVK